MEKLILIIKELTDALPTPNELAAYDKQVSTRDWATFFAAFAAFLTKLLPLILPLLTEPKTE